MKGGKTARESRIESWDEGRSDEITKEFGVV